MVIERNRPKKGEKRKRKEEGGGRLSAFLSGKEMSLDLRGNVAWCYRRNLGLKDVFMNEMGHRSV